MRASMPSRAAISTGTVDPLARSVRHTSGRSDRQHLSSTMTSSARDALQRASIRCDVDGVALLAQSVRDHAPRAFVLTRKSHAQ